jgi:methylated-DNA-[protein]-cysteine S-methyltransferase
MVTTQSTISLTAMRIYALVRKIPKGCVASYQQIAQFAQTHPRVVGKLLKNNSANIPCHRVVMTNGQLGGYFGSYSQEKKKLLIDEGVDFEVKGDSQKIAQKCFVPDSLFFEERTTLNTTFNTN